MDEIINHFIINSLENLKASKISLTSIEGKIVYLQHQHLRAFTISIPTVGKNIRKSLPKQWIMQVNAAYMDVEPRSPTMSGISSIPPSPPISSHKPPNETNSPKVRGVLNISKYLNI